MRTRKVNSTAVISADRTISKTIEASNDEPSLVLDTTFLTWGYSIATGSIAIVLESGVEFITSVNPNHHRIFWGSCMLEVHEISFVCDDVLHYVMNFLRILAAFSWVHYTYAQYSFVGKRDAWITHTYETSGCSYSFVVSIIVKF